LKGKQPDTNNTPDKLDTDPVLHDVKESDALHHATAFVAYQLLATKVAWQCTAQFTASKMLAKAARIKLSVTSTWQA
jgi:hypothetical protein